MKKRINLFRGRKRVLFSLDKYLTPTVRLAVDLFGILIFLIFIFIFIMNISLTSKIKSLEQQKKDSLNYLLQNKELEAKMRYFKAKESQINYYYNQDAKFLPYYTVLVDALKSATTSPSLTSVIIDKKRKTDFIITLDSIDSALNFLKHVESDAFTSRFENLSLSQFSVIQLNKKKETSGYKFTFTGVFKQVNDTSL